MFKSILTFFVVAAFVSWAMGAYNRLVRLRAAAAQAGALLQPLRQQLDQELGELTDSAHTTTDRLRIEAEHQLQSDVYAVAVSQYSEAIVQIPASWLTTLYGFKPIKKEVDEH